MRVFKDAYGNWKASSTYDVGEGRELEIRTNKVSSGSIVTQATVHQIDPKNPGWRVHAMYQDYSFRLNICKMRCTEKAIRELHEKMLAEHLENMKRAVAAHYATKDAA